MSSFLQLIYQMANAETISPELEQKFNTMVFSAQLSQREYFALQQLVAKLDKTKEITGLGS